MATLKVSEKTYRELNDLAGKLRSRYGRPFSAEAIEFATRKRRLKAGDLAGTMSITDEEAARVSGEHREFWSGRRYRSGR